MAMNAGSAIVGGGGTGLAQEMADLVLAAIGGLGTPPGSVVAEQQVDDLCNAIASAVVAHITANAVVSTSTTSTVAVTSVSGVTVGGGVSGPGAGTASGSGIGSVA